MIGENELSLSGHDGEELHLAHALPVVVAHPSRIAQLNPEEPSADKIGKVVISAHEAPFTTFIFAVDEDEHGPVLKPDPKSLVSELKEPDDLLFTSRYKREYILKGHGIIEPSRKVFLFLTLHLLLLHYTGWQRSLRTVQEFRTIGLYTISVVIPG
jgi:hypothetical protein